MGHRELGIAELDLTPESPIMLAWYKADKAAIIPRTDHVLSPSSSSATGRRATNREAPQMPCPICGRLFAIEFIGEHANACWLSSPAAA